MRNRIFPSYVAMAVSLGLTVGTPLMARADVIALQVPNIPGDAKFAASAGLPPDSIRVLTVGSSVKNPGCVTGGAGCSGKATFGNVAVVKKFGESSAPLFLAAALGQHLPRVTISFYRWRQGVTAKYYSITLDEVLLSSQTWVGNSGPVDSADTESLDFSYRRITFLDELTGSRACFDIKFNEGC